MKMVTIDVFALVAFSTDLGCSKSLKASPIARSFDFLLADMSRRMDTSPLAPNNFFYSLPTEMNR